MKTNIFLSYCWIDSKEAKKIYDYFKNSQNIELHRDAIDIGEWGSIKEYMQSIGNMDYAILLISDSYLKSANCMYEVLEVMRDRNYRDKIYPAILCTGIYSPITRAKYVKHWQDEFKELDSELKEIHVQNLGKLNEDLKRKQDISSNIAEFLEMVSDMNNPNIDDVCVRIEKKLSQNGFFKNSRTQDENNLMGSTGYIKENMNSRERGKVESFGKIPIENRAKEYADKWDKNVFLNDFDEEDENAGPKIRLKDLYIDECLPHYIRLRFIRKTHCQRDFMLWRGSARLGGVSGIDFNVLGNPAELVRKLKMNADIAVFVNLDMVYQFNQDFAGQLFDVLIFCKSYQCGMLLVNAV